MELYKMKSQTCLRINRCRAGKLFAGTKPPRCSTQKLKGVFTMARNAKNCNSTQNNKTTSKKTNKATQTTQTTQTTQSTQNGQNKQ